MGTLDYDERPRTFEDIVGHEKVIKDLKSYIKTGNIPHIMLAGPGGIGKNCIAQAFATEYFGRLITIDTGDKDPDYYEFNCSLWTGIDTIRNEISEILKTKSSTVRDGIRLKKIIFLNEFEELSDKAKRGLKSEIEVWAKNAIIIGATNYYEKIKEEALTTRWKLFKLKPPKIKEVSEWFIKTAYKYNVVFEPIDLVPEIAQHYKCSLRSMLIDCLEALRGYPKFGDGLIHIKKDDLYQIYSDDSYNYAKKVYDSPDPKRTWVQLWKQEYLDNRKFLEDYMELCGGKHSRLFAKIDSRLRRGCNPMIQMTALFDMIEQQRGR